MMEISTLRKRKEFIPDSNVRIINKADDAHLDDEREQVLYRPRPSLAIPEGSWLICLILTGFALWTRLYKINWNNHVVWDEAHFGYVHLVSEN